MNIELQSKIKHQLDPIYAGHAFLPDHPARIKIVDFISDLQARIDEAQATATGATLDALTAAGGHLDAAGSILDGIMTLDLGPLWEHLAMAELAING